MQKEPGQLLWDKHAEKQEKIMARDANSYSKTDTDATFMRMKEDHEKRQVKACLYNV